MTLKNISLDEVRGARISNIIKDGSAEAAGLRENDIIVKFDGVQ